MSVLFWRHSSLFFFLFSCLFSCFFFSSFQQDVPETFSWVDINLNNNYTFPLISKNKMWWFTQTRRLLFEKGLRRDGKKGSVGCAMRKIKNWYQDAPPSFCNLKSVLLYSEQHTGSSLLTWTINAGVKSVVAEHEFFCCDACPNRTEAILLYPKYLCSLNFPAVGVKTALIGLQRKQFWKNPTTSFSFPIENKIPVLFLIRLNAFSRYFSSSGFKGSFQVAKNPSPSRITKTVLGVNVVRKMYLNLYCKFASLGLPVMITSYEALTRNFSQTMKEVTTFLGAKGEGPWWEEGGEKGEKPEKGYHVPVIEKLRNLEFVKNYLRKNHPEHECLLYENCTYPPFDCSEVKSKSFNSTSTSPFASPPPHMHHYITPTSSYSIPRE